MPLTITDEELAAADLTADELRAEVALMLRGQDRMTAGEAAAFLNVTRGAFYALCERRGVPLVHLTEDHLRGDLESMDRATTRHAADTTLAAGPRP